MNKVLVFDPTANDPQSKVRGVGRYLQILRENFPHWVFSSSLLTPNPYPLTTFINPFFNLLSPPLFIKRRFKKQIAVIHDLIPLKYPPHFPIGLKGSLNVFLNRIALRSYDMVVTDSEQSRKDIITILKIKPERVKVIYPCLPAIYNLKFRIHNSNTNIQNSKFLLYVGDATWNKNLVNLAKAIKMQELPCVFAGRVFTHPKPKKNVWQNEFNEFMALAQNDKRFIFPGFIADKELIQLYQNALCNILISRDEGFGFSYLEASSQKCPSLLSDILVLREISQNSAFFVNPESPQSIVSAIKALQNDSILRNNLIKQSYARSTFFSQKNFVDDFNSIIS